MAAEEGKLDLLQEISEWAKYYFTRLRINNSLLLATYSKRKTASQIALEEEIYT